VTVALLDESGVARNRENRTVMTSAGGTKT